MSDEVQGNPRDSRPSTLIPSVERAGVHRRHVLYPNQYVWYVLVSTVDLMTTNTVMNYLGAREVNSIADWVLRHMGFWGMIGLKFATVVVVVAICEFVGAKRPALGKKIAEWAVGISAVPVVAALAQVVWQRL